MHVEGFFGSELFRSAVPRARWPVKRKKMDCLAYKNSDESLFER